MRRFFLPVVFLLFMAAACNSSDKKIKGPGTDVPKTLADSLMADVMDGHDAGMAKYGKLNAMQKNVQKILDSIATLPAKTRQAAAPYKSKLDSVSKDLNYALLTMDKWMQEFNMDSAVDNMEQRIKYLTEEKLKIGKVKEAILGSLQKADSVIKEKF